MSHDSERRPTSVEYAIWHDEDGTTNFHERGSIRYSYGDRQPADFRWYPSRIELDRELIGGSHSMTKRVVFRVYDLSTQSGSLSEEHFSPVPFITANSDSIRVRALKDGQVVHDVFQLGQWTGDLRTGGERYSSVFIAIILLFLAAPAMYALHRFMRKGRT